ncbi:MAG: cell division protein ZapA [Pseudomonadota bacterium]
MSQKSSDTCRIRILEKEYVINCKADERDMLKKSADYLNQRIKETRTTGGVTGGEKIVVMTALNLVYDYLSKEGKTEAQTDDNDKVTQKLQQINKKIETALHKHQQIELT